MANVDKPMGAFVHGPLLRVNEYNKDTGAAAIYTGDFVIAESDGNIAPAAAGSRLLGVALGYMAAASSGYIPVADHPDQLFRIQDDAGGTLAQTNIFNLSDIIATTGDTDTLRSKHELDAGTTATPAATDFQLRIVGLVRRPDNVAGANAEWIVQIREHELSTDDPATPGV